ncbi:MAG: hypothetical protein AB7P21_04405 [Lautropia sp.]
MTTLGLVVIGKGVVEFAAMLLVARGAVHLLSAGRHEANPVWRGLSFLTAPVQRAARAVTPARVGDRHLGLVAFLLLFWAWVVLVMLKAQALGAMHGLA